MKLNELVYVLPSYEFTHGPGKYDYDARSKFLESVRTSVAEFHTPTPLLIREVSHEELVYELEGKIGKIVEKLGRRVQDCRMQ